MKFHQDCKFINHQSKKTKPGLFTTGLFNKIIFGKLPIKDSYVYFRLILFNHNKSFFSLFPTRTTVSSESSIIGLSLSKK